MNLLKYLKKQIDRDDIVGDLAQDALRDLTFPKGSHPRGFYEKHLQRQNACEGAIEALHEAYDEMEAACQKST